MATHGYGSLTDRALVGFEKDLDDSAWKDIDTQSYEAKAKDDASVLLKAPRPIEWKIRIRFGIGRVLSVLGTESLLALDNAWDATQRRLFHRIAAGMDDEQRAVRDAADRLHAKLLLGNGTAQTTLDFDDEVDFGRQQIALTKDSEPLAADVKKVKIQDVLADVAKTTEALAKGLGRNAGEKRKPRSRLLRDAVAECAAAFNSVHEDLAWFIEHTPKGASRDQLEALLAPLQALLDRNASAATAPAAPEAPAEPAPPGNPA